MIEIDEHTPARREASDLESEESETVGQQAKKLKV